MGKELLNRLRPVAEKYLANRGAALERDIDAGGSAAVYVASKDGQEFALKVYEPALLQGSNALAELRRIDLQRSLLGHSCRYLVDFNDIVTNADGCFIEMGYVPWPSLKAVLDRVPIDAVAALVDQLVEAIRFLDSKSIVHRDIKPENILVSPDFNELRVIDLGIARGADSRDDGEDATDHGYRRPFIATAQYSAPEYLFRLQTPSARTWLALTLYQVGAVVHDLVTRRPLFADAARTDNKYILAMAVLRQLPAFGELAPQHAALAALAADCLVKDPELRLRLVSWDRFVSPRLSGPDLLRAVAAQHATLLNARRAREQAAATLLAERTKFLRDVEAQLRADLIGLMIATHTVTSYADADAEVRFSLRPVHSVPMNFALLFAWDDEVEPRLASVELVAAVGAEPTRDRFRCAAVAQAQTQQPVKALCEAALEKIAAVVGHLADQRAAGQLASTTDEPIDLVAHAGLA